MSENHGVPGSNPGPATRESPANGRKTGSRKVSSSTAATGRRFNLYRRWNPRLSLCERSVADHGRLVHVCVVGQLSNHKCRNILTRYRLGFVRTPEINSVFAHGRLIGELRRTHDHPL